jgi:hypothetical protein
LVFATSVRLVKKHGELRPSACCSRKHSDGATTVINVLPNMVVVYNKSGQFSQQIEAQELKALREALGVVNDG